MLVDRHCVVYKDADGHSGLQRVDMELQGIVKIFSVTLVRGPIIVGIMICSAPYAYIWL